MGALLGMPLPLRLGVVGDAVPSASVGHDGLSRLSCAPGVDVKGAESTALWRRDVWYEEPRGSPDVPLLDVKLLLVSSACADAL